MIENTPYTSDSTTEQVAAIRARVWLFDRRTVWFDELPQQTPYTVDLTFDEIEKHAEGLAKFALVVNLTDASRPDARTRRRLNIRFKRLQDRLVHCAYYTGGNALLNAAIRFVMRGMGLQSYSVTRTREGAIARAAGVDLG